MNPRMRWRYRILDACLMLEPTGLVSYNMMHSCQFCDRKLHCIPCNKVLHCFADGYPLSYNSSLGIVFGSYS